jgi:hypothetical protein
MFTCSPINGHDFSEEAEIIFKGPTKGACKISGPLVHLHYRVGTELIAAL